MIEERSFRTPRGRTVRLLVRPGTNDAMMAESSLVEDEYGLRGVELSDGWAVDVGAHIGMVTAGILIDNPACRVIAVECVPDNLELLRRNLELNGVDGRAVVIRGAVADGKADNVQISYDFRGGEMESMHRFVANQSMPDGTTATSITVPAIPLPFLVRKAGGHISLLVTDCEGGEYGLFAGKGLGAVAEIRGEYHDGFPRLRELLRKTHDVEQTRGGEGSGGFVARRLA